MRLFSIRRGTRRIIRFDDYLYLHVPSIKTAILKIRRNELCYVLTATAVVLSSTWTETQSAEFFHCND